MRKKLLVAGIILVAITAVPAIALAGTAGGTTPVNCQTMQWTGTSASTSSSSFTTVPGFGVSFTSIYPMAITVSADVKGQPVAFEIADYWVGGSPTISAPGPVNFTPTGTAPSAFSFTWTDPGNAAALRAHVLTLMWRRTSGAGTSTVLGGDIVVSYTTNVCHGSN